MDSKPGVIDRSNSYVSRSSIRHLLHSHRPRSPSASASSSRHRSSSGSSSTSILLPSHSNLTPIHTFLLQGSVFKESSFEAVFEFQRLLKVLTPSLETLNGSKSNITGRVFYKSRTFKVYQPEKEHVSVEAVQTFQTPTTTNVTTSSGGETGSSSPSLRMIVRDDHPPMLIGVRVDQDYDPLDDDVDVDDGDSSSGGSSSDVDGETNRSDGESHEQSDSDDPATTGEGVVTQRRKHRRRRRRRSVTPEIIDLDATPLSELLARQSSNPLINGSAAAAAPAAPGGFGHHHLDSADSLYNYYFYVRTIHNGNDDSFSREYVRLNWFRKLSWIDMSCTSISGYGVVSLVASSCSHIQYLFLSECESVDNTALVSIVNLCTSLRQIDISYCQRVTRFGLMYLAEMNLQVTQKCLELIDVSHCGGNDSRSDSSKAGVGPSSTIAGQTQASGIGLGPSAPPTSPDLISLSLFNALEERGFRGRFVWSHTPKREEFVGDPQIVKVPKPGGPTRDHMNPFAPPVQEYTYELTSPFLSHYQLQPHRILDLAMRDITSSVLLEVPWSHIVEIDRQRCEKLLRHRLQLGNIPDVRDGERPEGFVSYVQREMQQRTDETPTAAGGTGGAPPKFYAMNLSNHLINDRLLFYILINWGPRLYSLTLDGTYITSAGLKELSHCTNLHLLSLNSCLNLIDKTRANSILKDSLKKMTFLSELNLTNSRLSGRLMSSHENLKLDVLVANGCPISSFAIRMLATSSSMPIAADGAVTGGGGGGGVGSQNMCKYSLRFLSLAHCPFLNRKSLDYIFKFAYLELIDLSECKGLKKDDIVDGFLSQCDVEIRLLEGIVMGKSRKSTSSASGNKLTQTSVFGTMLCHLQQLICYDIGDSTGAVGGVGCGGGWSSEKRLSEFVRELHSRAMKIQQFMLLQYHQIQAQMEAAKANAVVNAQAAAAASTTGGEAQTNLAPPPIRQIPPPIPAFLRRDFVKNPIQVITSRSHPSLRTYAGSSLTRFIVRDDGGLTVVPAGVIAPTITDTNITGGTNGNNNRPTFFRGSSLLDDCPYSFVPTLPTQSTAAAAPAAVTTPMSPTTTTGLTRVASKTNIDNLGEGRSNTGTGTKMMPNASLASVAPSNSYMMLVNDDAVGGVSLNSTISPGGVPTSTSTPIVRNAMSPFGVPTPSVSPIGNPIAGGGGGDLYFAMTPDVVAIAQQQRAQFGLPQSSPATISPSASTNALAAIGEEGAESSQTALPAALAGLTFAPPHASAAAPATLQTPLPYSAVSYSAVPFFPSSLPATLHVPAVLELPTSSSASPGVNTTPSGSSSGIGISATSGGLHSSFASIATAVPTPINANANTPNPTNLIPGATSHTLPPSNFWPTPGSVPAPAAPSVVSVSGSSAGVGGVSGFVSPFAVLQQQQQQQRPPPVFAAPFAAPFMLSHSNEGQQPHSQPQPAQPPPVNRTPTPTIATPGEPSPGE